LTVGNSDVDIKSKCQNRNVLKVAHLTVGVVQDGQAGNLLQGFGVHGPFLRKGSDGNLFIYLKKNCDSVNFLGSTFSNSKLPKDQLPNYIIPNRHIVELGLGKAGVEQLAMSIFGTLKIHITFDLFVIRTSTKCSKNFF
jgi:hypothetical protein